MISIWAPVRFRFFRHLWAVASLNTAVDHAMTVAFSALVLSMTNRSSAWGFVLAAEALARAIALPLGGVVTDRLAPHRAMMLAISLRAAALGTMAAIAYAGHMTVPIAAGFGAVSGLAAALFLPSSNAAVPKLLPGNVLRSGNALISLTNTLATFLAPLLAGLLVTVAGVPVVIAAGAGLLLVLFLIASRLEMPALGGEALVSTAQALRDGLTTVRADPVIARAIIMAGLGSFGYAGAVVVGLPLMARWEFAAGDQGTGLALGAIGLGALIGTLLAGTLSIKRSGLTAVVTMGLTAVGLIMAAFASSMVLMLAWLVPSGAFLAAALIIAITMVQSRTKPNLHGRVISLLMTGIFGLTPLAYALGGLVGDYVGARNLVAGFACLMLGASLVGFTGRALREVQ